jgi:hypothetical protein
MAFRIKYLHRLSESPIAVCRLRKPVRGNN